MSNVDLSYEIPTRRASIREHRAGGRNGGKSRRGRSREGGREEESVETEEEDGVCALAVKREKILLAEGPEADSASKLKSVPGSGHQRRGRIPRRLEIVACPSDRLRERSRRFLGTESDARRAGSAKQAR
jgi:hypothetical protein